MTRPQRIYLFGGSFNPPGLHHRSVIQALQEICRDDDLIVIVPCGARPDKEHTNDIDPTHRAAMVQLAFAGLRQAQIDLFDLERVEFTRTWDLDARYRELFPGADVWHVVGTDLVKGGANQTSEIHRTWYRGPDLFKARPFVVVTRDDMSAEKADYPPNHIVADARTVGSSSHIRNLRGERLSIDSLVHPEVQRYIERWHLYTGRDTHGSIDWRPLGPALIVATPPNVEHPDPAREARVRELAALVERVNATRSGDPDHIVVVGGDGWMIDTISSTHLARRLPYLGLNAGTRGYLLNDGTLSELETRLRAGVHRLYRQPLLRVEYTDPEGRVHEAFAFNEAYLRAQGDQAAWMQVTIDGQIRFERLVGDGLMVSTPAGSTGWAYPLGATPVQIGTAQILLTGSATTSNGRRWVSAPLPEHATIQVNVLGGEKRPMRLVMSGRDVGEVTHATIRLSRVHAAELAFFPQTDLARKLMDLQLQ